jgi:hypothetical protein
MSTALCINVAVAYALLQLTKKKERIISMPYTTITTSKQAGELPVASLERKLINHPNGKLYVPVPDQAIYNFIIKPMETDLNFMKTYCVQYIERVTQDELRTRMEDGTIRTSNGVRYTVNWISSAFASLQAKELMLYFRTPLKNVSLYPRVLVSVVKPEHSTFY